MKQHIEELINQALLTCQERGEFLVDMPTIQVDAVKDKQHGDFATNIAMILAKITQKKPRDLAEIIKGSLPASPQVTKVEIAGPGFINFFLTKQAFYGVLPIILKQKEMFGHSNVGQNQKILLEYVSSNPTGPLHVGHGRHGAYGAVVANLLEAVGYTVHREYYVNDAGRQMDILATSVWLRYLELLNEKITIPKNAYKGTYIIDVAQQLLNTDKSLAKSSQEVFEDLPPDTEEGSEIYIDALIARAKKLLGPANYEKVFNHTLNLILQDIREDLQEFGVVFDEWFSERKFVSSGNVERYIAQLKEDNLVYEQDGAIWFRSTNFGDEKDRVLKRANGVHTYFANDLVYHVNKFERGFDKAITILGSDHHGYVPRMQAGLKAAGISPARLNYLSVQFVTLYRNNEQVQMSTRSGSFVTLRELRQEVGNDAARYFYVMRKCEQHIDFDLDLAKSKSNENPMYYVQYAHARICSVFRQMLDKNFSYDEAQGLANLDLLVESQELDLLATLSKYNEIILNAAENYEPHVLTNYLRELATHFHGYYNSHQFLIDDAALRNARLALTQATRVVLTNGLKLLGVSAPESM